MPALEDFYWEIKDKLNPHIDELLKRDFEDLVRFDWGFSTTANSQEHVEKTINDIVIKYVAKEPFIGFDYKIFPYKVIEVDKEVLSIHEFPGFAPIPPCPTFKVILGFRVQDGEEVEEFLENLNADSIREATIYYLD
jgi:hypothetical protein